MADTGEAVKGATIVVLARLVGAFGERLAVVEHLDSGAWELRAVPPELEDRALPGRRFRTEAS